MTDMYVKRTRAPIVIDGSLILLALHHVKFHSYVFGSLYLGLLAIASRRH